MARAKRHYLPGYVRYFTQDEVYLGQFKITRVYDGSERGLISLKIEVGQWGFPFFVFLKTLSFQDGMPLFAFIPLALNDCREQEIS